MGRSSSTQPEHSAIGVETYRRPVGRRRARSKVRPYDPVSPSRLSPPSNKHPSTSPLVTSLSSEEFFDAQEDLSEDEEDVFFECETPSEQHKPALAGVVQQIIPDPQYDGAAKGSTGVRTVRRGHASVSTPVHSPIPTTAPAMSGFSFGFSASSRGSNKPAATLATAPTATSLAAQAAKDAVPRDLPRRREAVKKALIIGMNYKHLPEDKRLYYAVKDAELWRSTLIGKGVSEENIRLITDQTPDGELPTRDVLIQHIRWLVQGAASGDSLFFVYSGHAVLTQFGASIVTADEGRLYKPMLENELVRPLVAGVDLQVVFDCCHSAGMLGLQYCVGRMDKPVSESHVEVPSSSACAVEPEIEPTEPARSASPFPHAPQHGSLFGISTAIDTAPPRLPGVAPAMVGEETFSPQPQPQQRHPRGTVVAAPPLPNAAAGNQAGVGAGMMNYVYSWVGRSSTPAPVQTEPSTVASARPPAAPGTRHARQGVAEGARMPDYFEERKSGYVQTAGKVMVWAGTGEAQKAFESYGRARQGVVTKAMCAALERVGTRRDLWSYLVQEIQSENDKRSERDACKAAVDQPIRAMRVQHAELWVSQGHALEPLRSAAPVLDQAVI